ncbi:MipA/OmpV family protein [Deltaproteobacteria bacterium TL4]
MDPCRSFNSLKTILLAGILSLFTAGVWAGQKQQWEGGLAVIGGQTPHYFGSNHHIYAVLPLPFFVYRLDYLQLGDSNKIKLAEQDDFLVEFSASGRWALESDDLEAHPPNEVKDPHAEIYRSTNYTRRGMEDLPFVLLLGINPKWYLNNHLYVESPLLVGVTVGSGFAHVGDTLSPTLSFDVFNRASNHILEFSVSWLLGDYLYNNYYYEVPAKNALEGRPEYHATSGLTTFSYGVDFSFDVTDQLTLGGGYGIHEMYTSVVRESPLIVAKQSRSIGIFLMYSFWQSAYKVQTWK